MTPTRKTVYRILVADDQQDILSSTRMLFKGEGIDCSTANSPAQALKLLRESDYDLVLLDVNYSLDTTSGQEGLNLISDIREFNTEVSLVVMTAWASVEIAVHTMKIGANDFITKPWDNERLLNIANNLCELSRSKRATKRLKGENELLKRRDTREIVADSPIMREILDIIKQVAPSDANILLTGENGTGKSLFAEQIHDRSLRRSASFIAVNMGGLPENLFESELFGHVKGAFTDAKEDRIGRYELADEGTLFLDEIGELSQIRQSTLLRLLETGEFERVGSSQTHKADVRIISATNSNLETPVASNQFRQDLYYRLNTVTIEIPPLRNRAEDIPALAESFLSQHSRKYKKAIDGFDSDALNLLTHHDWPGNIRELDHAIERATLLTREGNVSARSLNLSPNTAQKTSNLDEMSIEEVENYLIRRALKRHDGNAYRAAQDLGLSRSAFYRRLQKHGL